MTQGLFIIKDGKVVDLTLDFIFDAKYTHLLALTYSVDEGFLSQHMGHFEDVKLVVGIQDYFVQERAVTGMSASVKQALNYTISNELFENVNFFDSLSNENKLRLQNRSVEIKVPIGFSIHSKLYLLYNDTECRIKDEIKRSIQSIVYLMSNYKNYVIDYDDAYGSRILEAILCGFTSPFISEIRTLIASDSGRLDFPTFMFLGGRAGSGKSNLLECVSIMMGLKLDGKYLSYNSIIPKGVHNSKSILMKQLGNWLIEDNVAPLLIDEIDKDFFSNEQRGNELIVNTSNYTASSRHLSPCLIGTTNVEDYSLPERAQRRSYYIRFDKAFDRTLRKESNVAFEFVKNQLDDVLFQDFVMRFSSKLYNAEDSDFVQRFYSEAGLVDLLHYSREIFKEYFDIAGIDIPAWFPMTRHDDLAESNKELWRLLYLHDKELFKQNGDDYVFNLNELNKNQTGKYGQTMKSVMYKDALDPKVSKSVGIGDIVVLKVDSFHDWIGVAPDGAELDVPENRSWFQRLFGGK